ncbi:MAG: alpha-E domain-containing protein [Rhodobacterales bacterium]|nr:alpha-E domain-containing protein [Rhodobacterales bacterium]
MLSRTAANLYWMGRYIERSENIARILEAGYRMGQMPDWVGGGTRDEWHSFAVATNCDVALLEKHGEANLDTVMSYVVLDEDNPSSVHACLKTARTNARAVRTALTGEMWEALNDTWLEFDGHWRKALRRDNLLNFLDWVRTRSILFRGAMRGTMLRDDAFFFINIGTYIERADSTARILDVKYHILLKPGESLGGSTDHYQWSQILRSVSALGSYHWLYREAIQPFRVAELLILREEMPRSLRFALSRVTRYLDAIAAGHGQRHDCNRRAGQLYAQLCYDQIEDVFHSGLHEYLTNFLIRNNALGQEISTNFHF